MESKTVIYAPALYWFSYQYHDGLVMGDVDESSLEEFNVDWVQKQYEKVLSSFGIEWNWTLRKDEPASQFNLIEDRCDRFGKFEVPGLNLEGFIYPKSIHDAYALNLNVYYPERYQKDELPLKDLKALNPNNCFMPDENRVGYLGQTLLLSTYLPELLLYAHKVNKTFQQSRSYYEKADGIIKANEKQLEGFDRDYLQRESMARFSDEELKGLKSRLKELLKTSLYYSKALRNLEYCYNTIAINTKNYQELIESLEGAAQASMEGFRQFGEKEAINFQEQIQADLNYFRQGSGLLDKTIATLRGLVEIDQAESDRQWQALQRKQAKEERKAEQKLQDQIQAIGMGIATGSILASSFGLIT